MSTHKIVAVSCVIAFVAFCVWQYSKQPSNFRDWTVDQQVLPSAIFEGDTVHIQNIRNFSYTSTSTYAPSYYDASFDLNSVERVWYVSEPFDLFGAAHTFLSFEFTDGRFLAVSAEIRKEKGEVFSPMRGVLRDFELMYVIADERDVIGLRANHRKHDVYVYPLRTSKDNAKALFIDMLERSNRVAREPEFYNTVTNSCMTNILDHYREAAGVRIPYTLDVLLPTNGDRLLYQQGLIDTELSFEDARARFRVNEKAAEYASSADFSARIRER